MGSRKGGMEEGKVVGREGRKEGERGGEGGKGKERDYTFGVVTYYHHPSLLTPHSTLSQATPFDTVPSSVVEPVAAAPPPASQSPAPLLMPTPSNEMLSTKLAVAEEKLSLLEKEKLRIQKVGRKGIGWGVGGRKGRGWGVGGREGGREGMEKGGDERRETTGGSGRREKREGGGGRRKEWGRGGMEKILKRADERGNARRC